MSHIRSELQKKAKSYILQNAFLRWENAVVLAGTILLTEMIEDAFNKKKYSEALQFCQPKYWRLSYKMINKGKFYGLKA